MGIRNPLRKKNSTEKPVAEGKGNVKADSKNDVQDPTSPEEVGAALGTDKITGFSIL